MGLNGLDYSKEQKNLMIKADTSIYNIHTISLLNPQSTDVLL